MCSQLKLAGTLCRESSNSCDLPEFCTGANPHCPSNVYLHDGHACHDVDGYCYNGICQTHEQQCITLWGPGKSLATHLLDGVHFLFLNVCDSNSFFPMFVFVCRSKTGSRDMLWTSQLCRRPIRELRKRHQRLLCKMWCEVWFSGCIDMVEVWRSNCAKCNWLT